MNISDKAKNIISNCRFCWMCRHICPIGNATGLERNTARARAMCAFLVVNGDTKSEEIADNLYECTLCGACTNNCMTGFDPKVFVREMRTELILEGKAPDYILNLVEKYIKYGNIYGEEVCECIKDLLVERKSDTLVLFSEDAVIKNAESVKDVKKLLDMANVNYTFTNVNDAGSSIYFLTGKTQETLNAAKRAAEVINNYKTVIVYDPIDLSLIKHEYKEWGIEITANVIGFNEYLLGLIESGKLKVKKSLNEYTLQDNYAYARELDDVNFGRKLIEKVGVVKDVLLTRKEANLAGSLIMNEYMPDVIKTVAENRWGEAIRTDCKTFVTENPAEYVALKNTVPAGKRVISIEQMLLENI